MCSSHSPPFLVVVGDSGGGGLTAGNEALLALSLTSETL